MNKIKIFKFNLIRKEDKTEHILSVALKTNENPQYDEVESAFNIMLAEHKVDLSKYDYLVTYSIEEFNLAEYPSFYTNSYLNIDVRPHDNFLTFDPDTIFTEVKIGDNMYKLKTGSLLEFIKHEVGENNALVSG